MWRHFDLQRIQWTTKWFSLAQIHWNAICKMENFPQFNSKIDPVVSLNIPIHRRSQSRRIMLQFANTDTFRVNEEKREKRIRQSAFGRCHKRLLISLNVQPICRCICRCVYIEWVSRECCVCVCVCLHQNTMNNEYLYGLAKTEKETERERTGFSIFTFRHLHYVLPTHITYIVHFVPCLRQFIVICLCVASLAKNMAAKNV